MRDKSDKVIIIKPYPKLPEQAFITTPTPNVSAMFALFQSVLLVHATETKVLKCVSNQGIVLAYCILGIGFLAETHHTYIIEVKVALRNLFSNLFSFFVFVFSLLER